MSRAAPGGGRAPASRRRGSGGNQRALGFDALLRSYYSAWFRFHPEAAVDAGVAGFERQLTPFGDDDHGALVALNEKLLDSLEEIDAGDLDADRRIDYALTRGAAFLEMEELVQADWRYRDPARFLPVRAIYQLTVRPVADLWDALGRRLAAVPGHLRGARSFLLEAAGAVPPEWLASAVSEARAGVDFLRTLPRHPRLAADPRRTRTLDAALGEAATALGGFADFLEGEIGARASGDFACGRARFDHLLAWRHFLPVNADQLHAFGTALVEHTRRELRDACRDLTGHDDIAAASARIAAEHPPADRLLEAYDEQMRAARQFIERSGLVSLPETEHLAVVETPVFLRHLVPFAAYHEPAPNDPEQRAWYYVTMPDADGLAGHSTIAIMHTCVHEAWPGHHLQFVTAHREHESRTLPRLLNRSATLGEGWALYCEQLMHEQGFLQRPEHRVTLLHDRLWRALRVLIDVELHTRGCGAGAAARRLCDELGFAPGQAAGEIRWYSAEPTVPMSYATGWALINSARDQARAAEGASFSLRVFHDHLLSAGSVALPLALERVFGASLAGRASQAVFGA